jgi:hypothetical protein
VPDVVAGVVGVVFLFVWVYCLYDVFTTEESHIRNLPRIGWFLIVLLLFDIGSILWLCFGRPRLSAPRRSFVARQAGRTANPSRLQPLDDPSLDTMHPIVREREERARLRMWEAQLQRRELETRRREVGGSTDS